jgi:hypothetical protein
MAVGWSGGCVVAVGATVVGVAGVAGPHAEAIMLSATKMITTIHALFGLCIFTFLLWRL